MEFESSPSTARGLAIFFASLAFVMFYFAVFVASGAGSAVLFVIAFVAAVAAYGALSARYRVIFDLPRGEVEKRLESGLLKHSATYSISRFDSVGIGIGGRGGIEEPTVVYFVQLLGRENLKVSLTSGSLDAVRANANRLAEFLGLPLDDTPRSVVFGTRL
ncbi:MAG: hypothetical protein KJO38_00455 [Gammaproteobacteria bacterium]|nr:hypothetical protein [Gammaproteobacteria bacterium]